MVKGRLPAKYIRQAKGDLKKAWKLYRSQGQTSRSRRRTSVAKRRRYRRQMTIPLAVVTPLAGGIYAAAKHGLDSGWGWEGALDQVSQAFTGFSFINRTFDAEQMWRGLFPTLIGAFIHKAAGWLGINRILGQAKIPFIRI